MCDDFYEELAIWVHSQQIGYKNCQKYLDDVLQRSQVASGPINTRESHENNSDNSPRIRCNYMRTFNWFDYNFITFDKNGHSATKLRGMRHLLWLKYHSVMEIDAHLHCMSWSRLKTSGLMVPIDLVQILFCLSRSSFSVAHITIKIHRWTYWYFSHIACWTYIDSSIVWIRRIYVSSYLNLVQF